MRTTIAQQKVMRRTPDSSGASEALALAAELRAHIQGEVRFGSGDRALYATDASNYRQVPIGVVLPRSVEDVIQTVATCAKYGAPVLNRGGGTSLAGQCCNVAVVLDYSKYLNHVLEIDPERKLARVQPGTILDDLRAAAENHHLTFGPDPSTHNRCTLGGMIGNNSCGVHSVMAGKTEENVESLDILTYDGLRMTVGRMDEAELGQVIRAGGRRGEIYAKLKALAFKYAPLIRERFPDIPRRVSGFNLNELLPENGFNVARALVGTESTCVTVLEATLNLVHSPPHRVLVVLGYPDIYTACDHNMEILSFGSIGLEGFDEHLVGDVQKKGLDKGNTALLPQGSGWLMAEFGGETLEEARDKARRMMAAFSAKPGAPDMALLDDHQRMEMVWKIRESGLGATARIPGAAPTWPGWEDSAVEPSRFGQYLRDLRQVIDRYQYTSAFYGHFGQGCLHTRIDFDLTSKAGIEKFRAFMYEGADLVIRYGGSLSGEHGDGQARGELLTKMYGPELVEAFREFKLIWDPQNKMNPGKVVDAYRMDQNLRLGTDYAPAEPKTHFKFLEDGGSMASATLRCVGVGKCRRMDSMDGGTMCPSFMVTREEKDSTRGRAHLLFEMLRGDAISDGWRDDSVAEALDLCLACKGCKTDCPVNVDMATYKAEFLSHYYAGRLRPLTAYSMGLIYWWARLASLAPALVNFATHAPILSSLAKLVGGIAFEREIPTFAPQTFVSWFRERERGPRNSGTSQRSRVMLWPDTFNNHFHPETAIAAVEVLEAAGYDVVIPARSLCCGRPLYDFGMLDTAERLLRQILDTLRPQIEAGVPIVGLEPSCISVFRDELVNLFPNDADARRLKEQTFMLSEFLAQKAESYEPPTLRRKALVHGHCHHKSVLGMDAELSLLKQVGLDIEELKSGCCGMAGAFGFERSGEHYDVSIKCGERVLLPAVRDAAKDTLILADGFSCREQIAQCTDRQALHIAQVL
ncbi:MAG TPA: FAD-linked oxidase C-terminal domain-containing protein, partial [Ktedonobacterales bacterium]|nr:FAD-linked oxidase C-terminal domain-containing protein [Ktedonobacterales bacterium]